MFNELKHSSPNGYCSSTERCSDHVTSTSNIRSPEPVNIGAQSACTSHTEYAETIVLLAGIKGSFYSRPRLITTAQHVLHQASAISEQALYSPCAKVRFGQQHNYFRSVGFVPGVVQTFEPLRGRHAARFFCL